VNTETGTLTLPAPAKLNLLLQITGRREDGYHLLQTAFQFITLTDTIRLQPRDDARILLTTPWADHDPEDDLTVRAARLLASRCRVEGGVDIALDKRIPAGAGLGGGSSDAATVLHGLNHLWHTNLDIDELASLGLALGADVPVFVRGHAAWAEGIGEQLTPIEPPPSWYLLVVPPVHVSTAGVFRHPALTRNSPPIRISDFLEGQAFNSLEPVVRKVYPQIDECMQWLERHGKPRLTGTGAGVFLPVASAAAGASLAERIAGKWRTFVVQGINRNPLFEHTGPHDGA